ncbi:Hypothetical protein EHI5A_039640 [Entamoeba histolytica KU27]|uniref:Uncharacterized protein n=1 Tax=Entamoeba histolytica KU27 TaxID=885311 RepID=M2RBS4_ENTHI|nr:Hypothetical protein EHI5A_039640 [Entamoeba histolytica KU27]
MYCHLKCWCLIFLSFICPPVPIVLMNKCSLPVYINIILTFFFWLPGVIHSLVFIGTHYKKWYISNLDFNSL